MIRPDLELIRSIADAVAMQEGRRGGSASAHTLALETKTLAAYVEYLETRNSDTMGYRVARMLIRQEMALMNEGMNIPNEPGDDEILLEAVRVAGDGFRACDLWDAGLISTGEHAYRCECRYAVEDRAKASEAKND